MVIGSFRTPYITYRLVSSVQPNSFKRHFPRVDFTINGTLAHTLEHGIEIKSFPLASEIKRERIFWVVGTKKYKVVLCQFTVFVHIFIHVVAQTQVGRQGDRVAAHIFVHVIVQLVLVLYLAHIAVTKYRVEWVAIHSFVITCAHHDVTSID